MVNLEEKKSAMNEGKEIEKDRAFKVFFINNHIFANTNNVEILQLRNPQTELTSRYIVMQETPLKMFEILQFNEPNRSWFIDDYISSNGCIYITTPVDPLFFALHYLQEKCTKQYMTIDQILDDNDFTGISVLAGLIPKDQLLLIADYKENGNLQAFKYNESKTLSWLNFKLRKLAKRLQSKKVHIDSATQCASFVKSDKLQDSKEDCELVRYSYGIISEYISDSLSKKLEAYLGLEDVKSIKRKSTQQLDGATNTKRSRSDYNVEVDEIKAKSRPAEKKISAKEKARAKAATGAKSITSFFKAK